MYKWAFGKNVCLVENNDNNKSHHLSAYYVPETMS